MPKKKTTSRKLFDRFKREMMAADTSSALDSYRIIFSKINSKLSESSLYFPSALTYKYRLPEPKIENLANAMIILEQVGFFGRTIDTKFILALEEGKLEHIIYDEENGFWLPSLREEDRLIFYNPHAEKFPVQVWSNPNYIINSNHVSNGRNMNKSRFFKNKNIKKLEKLAFNYGLGHTDSRDSHSLQNRLFMYLNFSECIGKSKHGCNHTTIKIQCDRERKGKSRTVKIHGYPINIDELYENFPEGTRDVLGNSFQL